MCSFWELDKLVQLFIRHVRLHLGHNNPTIKYYIGDYLLNSCSTYKDLGIIVDDELKFKYQCSTIADKAYNRINLIFLALSTTDLQTLKWAYCVFARPILEYGCSLWSPDRKRDIDLLEKVQSYFTRRAFHRAGLDANIGYSQRLITLKMPSLELRRIQIDLLFLYKIINGSVVSDIKDRIVPLVTKTRGHNHRINIIHKNNNYRNPTHSIFKNFFLNRVISVWNELPDDMFKIDVNLNNYAKNKIFKKNIVNLNLNRFLIGNLL